MFLLLQSNPETLYVNMSSVQADVLVSNKVNIPGSKWFYFRTPVDFSKLFSLLLVRFV